VDKTYFLRKPYLQLIGRAIPKDSLTPYYAGLQRYELPNTQLVLLQDQEVGLDMVKDIQLEISSLEQLTDQLKKEHDVRVQTREELQQLQQQLDTLNYIPIAFAQISKEAKAAFPALQSLSYGSIRQDYFQGETLSTPVFVVEWQAGIRSVQMQQEEKRLQAFLSTRSALDTLLLLRK